MRLTGVKFAMITLLSCLLVTGLSTAAVLAAEDDNKGEVTILVGNESVAKGNYQLTDRLDLTAFYEDDVFKTGLEYQISSKFKVKAGLHYNLDAEEAIGYGGIAYDIPFGTNLKLVGFFDHNYDYEDCTSYESAIRVEMYPGYFIFAGVRGYFGSGSPEFKYNEDNDALLFLKGDFNWEINKYSIKLRPILNIKGDFFHDYDLSYRLNEQTALVLNINSLYDKETKYRIGVEYQF